MCSGRVEIPFVLRGLLAGADGVLVTGCHIGDCHYIGGNEVARRRMDTVRDMLNMLGIGESRMRLEWISAAEGQKFADTIRGFVGQISSLGPGNFGGTETGDAGGKTTKGGKGIIDPKAGNGKKEPENDGTENGGFAEKTLAQIIRDTHAYHCLSCGKCSGICPVTKNNRKFLPRVVVESAIVKDKSKFELDPLLWECLSCGMCSKSCPGNVKYADFIKHARAGAYRAGNVGECAHLGMIQDMMRLQSGENIVQKRTGWLLGDKGLKVSEDGNTLYFAGCLPYFDLLFGDIAPDIPEIARSTVKLMNKAGVEPRVLHNEKCCGHDMLWSGDTRTFRKLARQNTKMIRDSGVKRIVFSCPECYRTFKVDYPEQVGADALKGVELVHVSEFIQQAIKSGTLRLKKSGEKVTYHDPCRLGHHLGVYDAPREAIREGAELVEMERHGEDATCCGTSTWLNCNSFSKSTQTKRLDEAGRIAGRMLTACPKCYIHFSCAMSGKDGDEVKTKIDDLAVFIDRFAEPGGGPK
jgi:Fe-S oxidoreductase/coenzyme F420-reducing hydrogenase delta subunit